MLDLPFDNSFAREMDGFFVPWEGAQVPDPHVLRLNRGLAAELGVQADGLDTPEGAAVLSGAVAPKGGHPLAMAYAGHQFGGFSPQLGDGRALLLGEIVTPGGARVDLHLKGSGKTPFSRGGDGKAVLGPVLREYLFGEAMHALGIPTTRALAATTTGEMIDRAGPEPGAVLARVAASHLRVGTFQFFAARGQTDEVRQLADYAIARHDPDLADRPNRYLEMFGRVRDRQAALVAQWMAVGFVHGVMNTDNSTISGETIDYGPCAFIDAYDPAAVYSSIDMQGRYAYGRQPSILQWNLARLAETLVDVIEAEDQDDAVRQLTNEVGVFTARYETAWLAAMRAKMGLEPGGDDAEDQQIITSFLAILAAARVDFTQAFRVLSDVVRGEREPLWALFEERSAITEWLFRFNARGARDGADAGERAAAMDRVNPVYIPRNHKVEEALAAARDGDMTPFDTLLDRVSTPFERVAGAEAYEAPAPESFGRHVTFCGT